ncbi:MAG: hypothetical protein HQK84_04120 [Nitrospinae bacterium]|nr:hypothetical protein [Nitrospinota bacterium]
MLFKVSFEMLPHVHFDKVRELAMGWEREEKENEFNYKVNGKFGYYGSRSGFYVISATTPDDFYPMLKWFQEIFLWKVKPIHQLTSFYSMGD